MIFSLLPPDILSHILSKDISFMALELYKCGDKALNHRLENGGVVFIDLVDYAPGSLNRWPFLLPRFSCLRELSVSSRYGTLLPVSSLREQLQQLPRSLTTLKLFFRGATAAKTKSMQMISRI